MLRGQTSTKTAPVGLEVNRRLLGLFSPIKHKNHLLIEITGLLSRQKGIKGVENTFAKQKAKCLRPMSEARMMALSSGRKNVGEKVIEATLTP